MSSSEEVNGTKFLWKIENFSCIKDESLQSPTFRSHSSMWELTISPRSGHISIFLHKFEKSNEVFNCLLAFLNTDGSPLICRERKNYTFSYSTESILFHNFIEINEIFNFRRLFLPNNTLTVLCLIWKNPIELIRPLECFARTQFQSNAVLAVKSFLWIIPNVKNFSGTTTREELMGINADTLKVKLFLNNAEEFVVSCMPSLFKIHLKIEISALNVVGKSTSFVDEEHQFKKKEEQWSLLTNISKSMLTFFRNMFLPFDNLNLYFTCTQTASITFHRMVEKNEFLVNSPHPIIAPNTSDHSPPNVISSGISGQEDSDSHSDQDSDPNSEIHSGSFLQALQDMHEEGFLSDFILKTGKREFPVHKAVLGARSTVFRTMFTTEMREKERNCVDIEDIDEDTLRKLLMFVYSDKVGEDMGWENASRLYSAADKYALEPLKRKCSSILKSGLCISSALGVLKLSDMHHDQDMKSAALDFIERNDRGIVGTEGWLKFEEENAKLALETFRELYLKKIDA